MSLIRIKKGIRDWHIYKLRTFLIFLAMVVGIVGASAVINSYTILTREINVNYMATNPASFVLWSENTQEISKLAKEFPGVGDVEFRRTVSSRMQLSDGEWRTLMLYVIEDIKNSRINIFSLENGNFPVNKNEILIERAAFSVAQTQIGQTIIPYISGKETQKLNIVGSAYAAGLPPASMENMVYGFISKDAMDYLVPEMKFNEIRVTVADHKTDKKYIEQIAQRMIAQLENKGYVIDKWYVPDPGVHPHATQLNSFLFLLQIFGILILILSSLLVFNMINSMMAGQIRQIGIMKAIGAKSSQVMSLYYLPIIIISSIVLLIALPVGKFLGNQFAGFAGANLNFNITSYQIPFIAYLAQIAVGLLIPLLAASYPTIKGSRTTVKQALIDYGINKAVLGKSFFDRAIENIKGLPRPILMSIRNTFRKKGRLFLTLIVFSFGGLLFMLALNVNDSLKHTVTETLGNLNYDISINFDKAYSSEKINNSLARVDGIGSHEIWAGASIKITDSSNNVSFYTNTKGVPSNSKAFDYPLVKGRLLEGSDEGKIVISHKLAIKLSNPNIGDTLYLDMDGVSSKYQIVGIIKQVASDAEVYISYNSLVASGQNYKHEVYIKIKNISGEGQAKIFNQVEEQLDSDGLGVESSLNVNVFREAFMEHLNISFNLLLLMAVMVIIIGGIGLVTTMGINVMERTREIAIMRSIGASNRSILEIIITESIFVGLLSWFLSALMSLPLTISLGRVFGMIFLQTPLSIIISPTGILLWLVFIIIITAIAGYFPARKAYNQPVYEGLVYE